jgi:hypothetical protein
MRVPLRRTGAVSCGVLIGSLALARVIAPTGSRLQALMFILSVGAGVTLFAVAIAWSQASGDEIEAADAVRVTNRGVITGTMRRLWRNVAGGAQRVSRVWMSSAASIVTGLVSRLGRMVAALRHDVTRDAVGRWVRAGAVALSGVPPPDVEPPASAGRLARPRAARDTPGAPRLSAQAVDTRDRQRRTRGVAPRPTGPAAYAKPIHWSRPAGT